MLVETEVRDGMVICLDHPDSPPHRLILDHRRTHYGFATSERPSRSGLYYAVMIVEER